MGPKLIIHNTLDLPQNKQHKVHTYIGSYMRACVLTRVCLYFRVGSPCMYARSASVGLEQIFPLRVRKM